MTHSPYFLVLNLVNPVFYTTFVDVARRSKAVRPR